MPGPSWSIEYDHQVSDTAEIARIGITDTLGYWTVLSGPTLKVVEDIDDYLRHLRFGRAGEESTTRTYAGHLKRFHLWCLEQDLPRVQAARELARYVMRLRTTPRATSGRGHGELPADSTLGPALAAIHGFYLHLADTGGVGGDAVEALFTTVPAPAGRYGRSDGLILLQPRIRVNTRPSHQSGHAPAATHQEFTALLRTADTARDRCMIALLGACALRVGQLVSLWRQDMHLVPPGRTVPGCPYTLGPHLHLVKRDGHPRGAANKNSGTVLLPVPEPVVMLYADWMRERTRIRHAADNPWVFVAFPGPTGAPGGEVIGARRVQDLVANLAARAGLRHIHPHMLRHCFGETAADIDVARDVLQRLLGHSDVNSQDTYRHVSDGTVVRAAQAVTDKLFGST
ncbi:site-specific tyrosine recombinase XerC [Streptomyces sp. ADI92-24]|uniref:tyrosine-type recombinase/integrase n=1 Tax=Streptomyces sp. ADI92-24 TaxID=1522756 RepID=UPI000F978CF5|nr:tyrosine-type recombinase/integrase [Streptomyces sp. ADI92-24]RPK48390.1 site-specific tyrosine recombinase XerC [Streptomyces sp. ADI92-24]